MTDKLSLFNDALLIAGERFLASLTEEVESRRLLDQVWASNAVKTCLEEGQWFFATRTISIDYDPSIQPSFGYNRAFLKPDDWVLTCALCTDEFFRSPQLRYVDEAGYWYSDIDTLYVRYVSDDDQYGNNLNEWPDSFREFVAAHLATKIVLKLGNDENEWKKCAALRKQALRNAKGRSLMAEPTSFPARGEWSKARNRYPYRRDGGNTSGNLVG